MTRRERLVRAGAAILAVTVLMAGSTALAGSWWETSPTGSVTEQAPAAASAPTLTVATSGQRGLSVRVETPGIQTQTLSNKQGRFVELTWPDAKYTTEIGDPALPVVRELVIIPAGATAQLTVNPGTAVVLDAKTLGVPPVVRPLQHPVPKIPGASENMPFDINADTYKLDANVIGQYATFTEVGIMRGQRVALLEIYPVDYNPGRQVVTVYPDMTATVSFTGGTIPSETLSAMPGLDRVVLNPELLPAATQRGTGNYLIVVADSLAGAISSFATAKTAQGFDVTVHQVADGTSAATIKTYIQSLYGGLDSPDYILLVGDTELIPNWTGGGEGSPATDIQYGCLEGTDYYPEVPVGRFPADDPNEVADVVAKTLYFENGPLADPDYVKRAVFMASVDHSTVSEGTHNYVIDNYMSSPDDGWQVDKLYQVTYGATTQDVIDSFNDGRFFGIYSGHGGTYSWADGPPLSQEQVEDLVNEHMYACVCSFACVTGTYTVDECFMETWILHATGGAVTAWGSSVNSYWDEDDILEKVLFDAIFDETQPEIAKEVGPIYNEARVRYLAHWGESATTRRYFEMYNLMGDPSVAYPGNCSDAGNITVDSPKYACEDTVTIRVGDCGLNLDDNLVETVTVTISSDLEAGEAVLLTETNPGSATFEGSIAISATDGVGILLVAEGNTVTATYEDADTGEGVPATVTATAVVDCTGPTIQNVHTTAVEPRAATITFDCDEPVSGTVYYGLTCGDWVGSASGGTASSPSVTVSGLQDGTTYYYMVEATDEAGNTTADDNNGACYMFATPEIPDFFTEQFTAGGDLQNIRLLFTPVGTFEFYFGCTLPITDLPVDPTGGTVLTFSDDDNEEISLLKPVSLYGEVYDSFYICSNGYVTFGESTTDYDESLAKHFGIPRVAAWYDDLMPPDGGTISYKQLSDRVAVTFDDVRERSSTNTITFQIELFYDGRIAINYLNNNIGDGIVGLSAGDGLSPDFYMSDLSAMISCGPQPPIAVSAAVQTPVGTPVAITLMAADDGEPDPPAELTYTVLTLPVHGTLSVLGGPQIATVPYALGTAHEVSYAPSPLYAGPDSFSFLANDGGTPNEGGDSNIAVISITVGGPQAIYSFPMDASPAWATTGDWAFGTPTGQGGEYGSPDPTAGHTGTNVYAYNLDGDYPDNMSATQYLTTTAIDCSEASDVELRFWRWLGVEQSMYDHAMVEVSNNGTTWTTLWSNPSGYGYSVADSNWTECVYDISAVADHQATVYIRWGLGVTDGSVAYCGWNIDDVELWGIVPVVPPLCPGDLNCDGVVDYADIDPFVEALTCVGGTGWAHDCPWLNGDCNGDENVTYADIDPFVGMIGTTCP